MHLFFTSWENSLTKKLSWIDWEWEIALHHERNQKLTKNKKNTHSPRISSFEKNMY